MLQVDPQALFNLLLALEKDCPDNLDILDMVDGEKPLTALVSSALPAGLLCFEINACYSMIEHRGHPV